VPLIHCISDDFVPSHAKPSPDAASVHRSHELDEYRKCSLHPSVPNGDILALNLTQEYTHTQITFIWLIVNNKAKQ